MNNVRDLVQEVRDREWRDVRNEASDAFGESGGFETKQ